MKQIVFIKTEELYLKTLIDLFKKENIEIKKGDYSIGICLDIDKKVLFPLNVTCMCGFSQNKNRPLVDFDVLENYESFVIKQDEELLDQLYKKSKKDLSRPIGGFYR